MIKFGYQGKVLEALRILYRKTYFRIESQELIRTPIPDKYGVNQGVTPAPPYSGINCLIWEIILHMSMVCVCQKLPLLFY